MFIHKSGLLGGKPRVLAFESIVRCVQCLDLQSGRGQRSRALGTFRGKPVSFGFNLLHFFLIRRDVALQALHFLAEAFAGSGEEGPLRGGTGPVDFELADFLCKPTALRLQGFVLGIGLLQPTSQRLNLRAECFGFIRRVLGLIRACSKGLHRQCDSFAGWAG